MSTTFNISGAGGDDVYDGARSGRFFLDSRGTKRYQNHDFGKDASASIDCTSAHVGLGESQGSA